MFSDQAALQGEAARAPSQLGDEVAIRVTNLSKCYHIYDRPQDRLKQSILSRLQRLVGRPPKQYHRDFWALKDVSFEVKKGETVGIVGRNGSGKSTLLQMICGTLTPTSGTVETSGRVAALLELGSGFNPEFTGRENVYMNGTLLGLGREEIDVRFDDIAAFADIGEFIEQPVKTYSSGMLMRLAFAVIAHVDPEILVIDEALAVGDSFFVQKCMRFLRGFQKRGTVLFVSHDTAAVIALCQRANWLEYGKIRRSGSAKDICESYLEAVHESWTGVKMERQDRQDTSERRKLRPILGRKDMRLDPSNGSGLRDDSEVFSFDSESAAFGAGGATIVDARLLDETAQPLALVVGGEPVVLTVTCVANRELIGPIVGFFVKDRLGQTLFGDNTYLTHAHDPLTVPPGSRLEARFRFDMPRLPAGEYSIAVAIAEGTQANHIQLHWMHDAFVFKSHSTTVATGLIGIPVHGIDLHVGPAPSAQTPRYPKS